METPEMDEARVAENEASATEQRFLAAQLSRTNTRANKASTALSTAEQHNNSQIQSLTKNFWSSFYTDKEKCVQLLLSPTLQIAAVTAAQRLQAEQLLETLINLIQTKLIQSAAHASSYLVSFDVRKSTEIGESLLKQVESARLVCIPRERFRFKCRDKYSQRRAITKQNSNENDNNGAAEAAENFNGFFDRTDEKLLLVQNTYEPTNAKHPNYYLGDFRLRNLKGCVVTLVESFGALRLQGLRDCTVYAGPTAGPCYVEDCVGCNFYVSSRQLRIHDTFDTKFFVCVSSGPIIEDCKCLFGRYNIEFKNDSRGGMKEMFEAAGLSYDWEEKRNNFWREVKDFKWHKMMKSPNFDLIEDGEGGGGVENKDEENVMIMVDGNGEVGKEEELKGEGEGGDTKNETEKEEGGEEDEEDEEEEEEESEEEL